MSSSSWWSTKHSLMQIPTWIISFFLATNWVVVITHTFSLVCGWNSNLTHNSQLFIWKPVQMSSTWFDTSLNSTHKYIWKKSQFTGCSWWKQQLNFKCCNRNWNYFSIENGAERFWKFFTLLLNWMRSDKNVNTHSHSFTIE